MADKTLDFSAALAERRRNGKPQAPPSWLRKGAERSLPQGLVERLATGARCESSGQQEPASGNIAMIDMDRKGTECSEFTRAVFPEAALIARAGWSNARFVFKGLEGDRLVVQRYVNGAHDATLHIGPDDSVTAWEGTLRDGRRFELDVERVEAGDCTQGVLGNVKIIVSRGEPVSEGPVLA